MARHRLSRWQKVAVLALMGWGLLTIAPDVARPVGQILAPDLEHPRKIGFLGPYGALEFTADNDGHVEWIDDAINADPPNCIKKDYWIEMKPAWAPNPELLKVFGGMGGLQYVRHPQSVKLSIAEKRGGPAKECTIKAIPLGHSWAFWLPILAEDIAGCLFILLCAWIVWHHPSPATWGFFFYGIWFNPGQYFAFYAELQQFPTWVLLLQETAQSVFQAAGYVGFIVFALQFPNEPVAPAWRPLYRGLPAIGFVLALLQLLSFATAFGYRTELITRWSYRAGLAVDACVCIILYLRYRTMPSIDRQRTRWVLWLGGPGLLAFIVADVTEATSWLNWLWSPSEATLAFFYSATFLVAGAIFIAITRHRVYDVRFRLARWTTFLLASGFVLVGLYVADEILHENLKFFTGLFGAQPYRTVLIPVGVALTFGAEKLREGLNEVCNRLFFPRLHRTAEDLDKIKGRFEKARTYDRIDELLVSEPVKWLDIASAAVFRKLENGVYRRQRDAVGWPAGTGEEIPMNSEVVSKLKQTRRAMRLDKGVPLSIPLPRDVAEPVLAIPICNAEDLSVIALYGAHRKGDDILKDELKILTQLAESAATAYAQTEARALREELERLRRGQIQPHASPA